MSDPFLDNESGPESSRAREFYDIVQSAAVTYRVASGQRDIVYGGNTYVATPMARTEIGVSSTTGDLEMTLALPLSHPLCQRYSAMGTPPRQVSVTVWRQQLTSGVVEQIRSGYVTSMGISGHLGKFLIPSRMARTLQRMLPSVTVGKLCPHILYDQSCRADPAAFSVTTTVVSFDGRKLVLASVGSVPPGVTGYISDDTFLHFGELRHVATGERETIFAQTGTVLNLGSPTFTIDMQAPIPDIQVGDSVTVVGGCDHTKADCYTKFANMANYGGFPELPTINLFFPGNGRGIYST